MPGDSTRSPRRSVQPAQQVRICQNGRTGVIMLKLGRRQPLFSMITENFLPKAA
jgi:hypothetical protein